MDWYTTGKQVGIGFSEELDSGEEGILSYRDLFK